MKTKLLKKWRFTYKVFRLKTKFLTEASAYRSTFGDIFFCWFIKHHHLYETISLECSILGVKPSWLWREKHPLHRKYAPSYRFKIGILSLLNAYSNIDFASIYPISLATHVNVSKIDMTLKLSEDLS